MGEVVIELPIEVNRRFRITDVKVAARVLRDLEDLEQIPQISSDVTDEEVLTVWANRSESPDEIARQLRQDNRRHG
jgi:hypothetical protein